MYRSEGVSASWKPNITAYTVALVAAFLMVGHPLVANESPSEEIRLYEVRPDFGLPGTKVVLGITGGRPGITAVLSGQTIEPDEITSDKLTFTIPEGAKDGAVWVRYGEGWSDRTNAVIFKISDDGLIRPSEYDVEWNIHGGGLVHNHLIVKTNPESTSRQVADELAKLVSGKVIGKVEDMRWWQIKVDATTYEDLKSYADAIEADDRVEDAWFDFYPNYDIVVDDPARKIITHPQSIKW